MPRNLACASVCLFLFIALGGPSVTAAEAERRVITHEDVWLMKRPGAVAVSPDGRWIIVSVAEPAYDDEQKRSDLWIAPADGSAAPRRLTSGKSAEGDPVFSPDSSRVAFSGKREGDEVAQVYVLDLSGGEAQKVTDWPTGARTPRFSPDGQSILFVGLAYPGAGTAEENRKAAAERKERKYTVRAYDSFPIRHWDRWLDELRPTLVLQPLDGSTPARDLLAGSSLRRQPGFGGRLANDGETLEATWTPDGRGVIFAATTNRHEAARAEVQESLWQLDLDGVEPRRLTSNEGDYAAPAFSPDGEVLLAKFQPASERHVYRSTRQTAMYPWTASPRRPTTARCCSSRNRRAATGSSRLRLRMAVALRSGRSMRAVTRGSA